MGVDRKHSVSSGFIILYRMIQSFGTILKKLFYEITCSIKCKRNHIYHRF
jgi:hypothetical protein